MKVDDHTVDFVLPSPNPILHYEWDTWYIMSKKWAEANNSAAVQPASGQQMSYAALNTNGTGPFILTSHQAGVRTIFKKNPNWWGKVEHNIDEAIFTTIGNDATRVAALLSGDVDWIDPVPLQDVAAHQCERRRRSAAGTGAAHDLPRLRPDAAGAEILERQGQEPVQGRAGAPGVLSGDRRERDRAARDAQAPRCRPR